MAAKVAENHEWWYKIAREIIGFGHRRVEWRNIQRMVEKLYRLESLVRVLQNIHLYGVP